jgi:hypothetical protein
MPILTSVSSKGYTMFGEWFAYFIVSLVVAVMMYGKKKMLGE